MKLFKLILIAFIGFTSIPALAQKMASPYADSPSIAVNPFVQAKVCHKAGHTMANPIHICTALAENTLPRSINLLMRNKKHPGSEVILKEWAEFMNVPTVTLTLASRVQNHFVNIVRACKPDKKCIVDGNTFILLTRTQALLVQISEISAVAASSINTENAKIAEKFRYRYLMHNSKNAEVLAYNIGYYFLGEKP